MHGALPALARMQQLHEIALKIFRHKKASIACPATLQNKLRHTSDIKPWQSWHRAPSMRDVTFDRKR
jgi:hypothetical protein